jgi:hypothetical protein
LEGKDFDKIQLKVWHLNNHLHWLYKHDKPHKEADITCVMQDATEIVAICEKMLAEIATKSD